MTLAEQCPWYVAGPLLGLVVIAGRWLLQESLGAVGSYAAVHAWTRSPKELPGWRVFFLVGLILGGGAFVLAAGAPLGAGAQVPSPTDAGLLLGGGLLMGLGGKTAGGCTLGHGLCGTSQGSPASFAATMTFMGVAIVAAHALQAVLA